MSYLCKDIGKGKINPALIQQGLEVAGLKLGSMGISIDTLTDEQEDYIKGLGNGDVI